jgi:hypothetical protein
MTYDPPAGGFAETVCIVGRQSGKTRIAATIASFEAVTARAEGDGTETYALLIAQDHRAALRALFRYAGAPFERVPVLARSVTDRKAEALTLESGCVLAAYPCRPQAVRGVRARVVVADELAFYRSSEGFPTDAEMLRAVRPTLATTRGKLVILSSPYAQAGALYDLHRKHFGRDGSPVLVWQATAPAMNPTLPTDYLARMEQDDPDAYRSEVLGEFRGGVMTFLDPEALAACVELGVRERPPDRVVHGAGVGQTWTSRHRYVGYVDAASGSGKDRFAIGIAHADGARAVLDVCRAWTPPFNPMGVIAEASTLFTTYRVTEVEGDRYAPGFVAEGFRSHGLTYRAAGRTSSEVFLETLPRVNAGTVVLLDLPELLTELRGLERRRGASGQDRVSHRPGAHDDRAVAACGALLRGAKRHVSPVWGRSEPSEDVAQRARDLARAPTRLRLFNQNVARFGRA